MEAVPTSVQHQRQPAAAQHGGPAPSAPPGAVTPYEHVRGMPVSDDVLLAELRRHFGHSSFREGQREVVRDVCEGKDTIVLMPTGRGKSLCYGLPAMMMRGVAIIVSPLVALMSDQVRGFRARGVCASALWSGMSDGARQAIYADLAAPAPRVKLLLVTPEGLETSRLHSMVLSLHGRGLLSLLALDEAHVVCDWGHAFRPSYRRVGDLRPMLTGVPFMALTASATPRVVADLRSALHMSSAVVHAWSVDRHNLRYAVVHKDALPCVVEDIVQQIREVCGPAAAQAPAPAQDVRGVSGRARSPAVSVASSVDTDRSRGSGRRTPPAPSEKQTAAGKKGKGKKAAVVPSRALTEWFSVQAVPEPPPMPVGAEVPDGDVVDLARADVTDNSCDALAPAVATPVAPRGGSTVVYTHKREEADELAADLSVRGISAAAYHAGMSDGSRTHIQREWSEGRIQAVVATVAFGMGIDKADVRFVAHFNLPKSMEGLYQEAGRAGRDGAPSLCKIYYSRRDKERLEFITQQSVASRAAAAESAATAGKRPLSVTSEYDGDGASSRSGGRSSGGSKASKSEGGFDQLKALQQVVEFCEKPQCRRLAIMRHFGETPKTEGCTPGVHELCDYCADPPAVRLMCERLYGNVRVGNDVKFGFSAPPPSAYMRSRQRDPFVSGTSLMADAPFLHDEFSDDDEGRARLRAAERSLYARTVVTLSDEEEASAIDAESRKQPRVSTQARQKFNAPRPLDSGSAPAAPPLRMFRPGQLDITVSAPSAFQSARSVLKAEGTQSQLPGRGTTFAPRLAVKPGQLVMRTASADWHDRDAAVKAYEQMERAVLAEQQQPLRSVKSLAAAVAKVRSSVSTDL